MEYLIGFVIGVIIGSTVVFIINRMNGKAAENAFAALSSQALRNNSEEFLRLANETLAKQSQTGVGDLDTKKQLIDQTLDTMKGDLLKVEKLLGEIENKREKSYGEISTQLKNTADQTSKLQDTTNKLHTVLASTKMRGQWGERMAEDILRMAGLIDGKNYFKQQVVQEGTSRPDYTFPLPGNLKVNMDVKFPLDNYMKYVNDETEIGQATYKQQFIKDARQRIKEVTTRDYINSDTVDYVIVFIPSEQVYCFIHQNDASILDDALKSKVILCSPLTLYAILSVIRKGVENFNLSKTTTQIIELLTDFGKQWDMFKKTMDKMGNKITEAQNEFRSLVTTRTDKLEKPLRRIDDLAQQRLDSGVQVACEIPKVLAGEPEVEPNP